MKKSTKVTSVLLSFVLGCHISLFVYSEVFFCHINAILKIYGLHSLFNDTVIGMLESEFTDG